VTVVLLLCVTVVPLVLPAVAGPVVIEASPVAVLPEVAFWVLPGDAVVCSVLLLCEMRLPALLSPLFAVADWSVEMPADWSVCDDAPLKSSDSSSAWTAELLTSDVLVCEALVIAELVASAAPVVTDALPSAVFVDPAVWLTGSALEADWSVELCWRMWFQDELSPVFASADWVVLISADWSVSLFAPLLSWCPETPNAVAANPRLAAPAAAVPTRTLKECFTGVPPVGGLQVPVVYDG
jgi:hypothetical protein